MTMWATNILDYTKESLDNMIAETLDIDNSQNLETRDESTAIYGPFQLPIRFVETEHLHDLSPIVTEDLELVESTGETSVYEKLFQPTHLLGSSMIKEWKNHFTSNQKYIEETQQVIIKSDTMPNYNFDIDRLLSIYKELNVNEEHFLEKYGYIEWDFLKILNKSPNFLQILSLMNMMSPVLSLLLPIVFLIFPFIILKLRKIPISVSMYISVLKDIAKHHFIGKTIANLSSLSFDRIIYFFLACFMFCYQIYQNVISCKHFYNNIVKLSSHLHFLKYYLGQSIQNMDEFIGNHCNKSTYHPFCEATTKHRQNLLDMYGMVQEIDNSSFTLFDIGKIGNLLHIYYEFHSNKEFDESLRYSFGFEGFLDNLRGIKRHMEDGNIHNVSVDKTMPCSFNKQYYPLHTNDDQCVKNDCNLKKKIIITGPNASGKTTLLKTSTINIIFSQQIGCGFYQSGTIHPYTHIHSYLNIPDTSQRDSLFQAESRRCKEIIDVIYNSDQETTRHYGIFDELYSGTNPDEATKTGYAFLKYLTKYKNVDFILTTHYHKICSKLKNNEHIQNYQMNVIQENDKFVYTYKMKKGISKVQGALQILEDMEYPTEIIQEVKLFNKKQNTKHNTKVQEVQDSPVLNHDQ